VTPTTGDDRPLTASELLVVAERLQRRLAAGLAVALADEATTVDQWRTLELVDRLDGPTMGRLAEASGLPNATLSRVVDALEDSAALFRLPDPGDRRRLTVRLTDTGRDRLGRLRHLVAAWDAAVAEELATPDAAQVRRAAGRLSGRPRPAP
jgi:DNA-binding MarR family transcriptional regulator